MARSPAFVRLELVGGPNDGELMWYNPPVPKLVEFSMEAAEVEGSAFPKWANKPRIVRYLRTSKTTMDFWPNGKQPPPKREPK